MNAIAEKPRTEMEPRRKSWSLTEFIALNEEGHFQDQRVELLAGEIYIMPRQDFDHSFALTVLCTFCREVFGKDAWVRDQMPLQFSRDSYLEPDISVVLGKLEDYQDHPETAIFVAEVSNYTLRHDRRKAALYARAGIPEYWIVNLQAKLLEIYRNPHVDGAQPYGFGYDEPIIHQPGESAALLHKPDQPFEVQRLFR